MVANELHAGTWVTFSGGRASALCVRRCRIEVVAGSDAGLVREFEAPTIRIGGRKAADLTLSDRAVSGFHIEIQLDERGYRLRDLDSTNGTFVAGMRVNDVYINPGASIFLGETELCFQPLDDAIALDLSANSSFGRLVGSSPVMRELFARLERIAATDATLLVTGETGTGKDLVAEAVHHQSARAAGPFVVLDCSALPPNLVESELFGHERGAFTGAGSAYAGAFERADGGTLFIDEIGELPLELQPKLLRAIEGRQVRRLGGATTLAVDIRIIAATNRDLGVEVSRGGFREDLYYRLVVAHVHLPRLSERRQDIPAIIEHLLAVIPGGDQVTLQAKTIELMSKHDWPGNVRELRNVVERAVLLREEPASATALRGARPAMVGADSSSPGPMVRADVDVDVAFKVAKREVVDQFEREYIRALLERHHGNISAVARAAGVDRMSIYRIAQRLGLLDDK